MNIKFLCVISICSIIFSAQSFCANGKAVMEKMTEFGKCLVEKSNKSAQEKSTFAEKHFGEESTLQMNEMAKNMDQNCSQEELTKIVDKVECFAKTCDGTESGFVLEQKMERIMRICVDDLLYPSLTDRCIESLPFGGPPKRKQ
ncbi:MAG TPA: hypothetical protein VEL47_03160 [Myxococcota bacterium]|nr:hypothetical protein [Myxococcota bacterium]